MSIGHGRISATAELLKKAWFPVPKYANGQETWAGYTRVMNACTAAISSFTNHYTLCLENVTTLFNLLYI